ncbi:MAG: YceI family protein [Bacteriovoracaceae bacterium]|jgi:polyisoprenoid-binding protein YceI
MKKLIVVALSLVSLTAFAQTYKVDTAKTKIEWLGKKVTGQHNGTISAKAGSLVFKEAELTGGEIIVDVNSMTCTDLTDPEYNAKFLGHMKSADFFDVAKYPEAKMVIKSVKKAKKGYDVTVDFTLVGNTAPLTFNAEITKSDKVATIKSKFKFDRTKWNLKYGSSNFFKGLGDKAINDDVELTVDLAAAQ